jgi:hypothetical protein
VPVTALSFAWEVIHVVTPEEAQRLALIRYQLTLALQQAEQPSPMNGLSVLGFQAGPRLDLFCVVRGFGGVEEMR